MSHHCVVCPTKHCTSVGTCLDKPSIGMHIYDSKPRLLAHDDLSNGVTVNFMNLGAS